MLVCEYSLSAFSKEREGQNTSVSVTVMLGWKFIETEQQRLEIVDYLSTGEAKKSQWMRFP